MGLRDQLRATAIALVLLMNLIYALPFPPELTEKAVRKEVFQNDLATWEGLFRKVGVEVEHADFQRTVVAAANGLHEVGQWAKAPFRPFMDLVGANQAWALFASASTRPDRLEIAVRTSVDGEWTTLLRRLDPCCTWHEPQLEYRRIRGSWDGQSESMRPAYRGLTRWIAARVFEEQPDAVEVRVQLVRERRTYPWEPEDDRREPMFVRVHDRADLAGPPDGRPPKAAPPAPVTP